jgi:hypothetical protein
MTCPTCSTWICYVCRLEIPKAVSYKHFCQTPHCQHARCGGCPLYSNAEEDDARASREAGLKAVEKLAGGTNGDAVEKLKQILNEEEKQSQSKNQTAALPADRAGAARARADAAALAARQAAANRMPRIHHINPNAAIQGMQAAEYALNQLRRAHNPGYLNGVPPHARRRRR